jgi:hypothetical protein
MVKLMALPRVHRMALPCGFVALAMLSACGVPRPVQLRSPSASVLRLGKEAAAYLDLARTANRARDAAEDDLKQAGRDLVRLHAAYADLAASRREFVEGLRSLDLPSEARTAATEPERAVDAELSLLDHLARAPLADVDTLDRELGLAGSRTSDAAAQLRSVLGIPEAP